jgi:hypothetical protein
MNGGGASENTARFADRGWGGAVPGRHRRLSTNYDEPNAVDEQAGAGE